MSQLHNGCDTERETRFLKGEVWWEVARHRGSQEVIESYLFEIRHLQIPISGQFALPV